MKYTIKTITLATLILGSMSAFASTNTFTVKGKECNSYASTTREYFTPSVEQIKNNNNPAFKGQRFNIEDASKFSYDENVSSVLKDFGNPNKGVRAFYQENIEYTGADANTLSYHAEQDAKDPSFKLNYDAATKSCTGIVSFTR